MKRKLSDWSKDIKKAMIDLDMDTSDVAKQLGWTRQYTSSIINGRTYQHEAVVKLSYLFSIRVPVGTGATLATVKESLEDEIGGYYQKMESCRSVNI